MKIQELAIIFVIIILPISLLLSEYTQFQIQTLKTQTEYDSKLTAATYDAIKAFQLNSTNSTESGLANSEMRDLTASVNTFRNSLMSTFKLNGYTEEELNSYIPALVYTLYDGFYLYSPYQNENHRYEIALDGEGNQKIDHITGEVEYVQDGAGNDKKIDGNGEQLYGVKPYISYSSRYIYPSPDNPRVDVVITYALDNHITVQGMIENPTTFEMEYVNKSGYLIEIDENDDKEYGIYYKAEVDGEETVETVKYNGEIIEEEYLREFLPIDYANKSADSCYSYAKINGIKYYLIPGYYEVKDSEGNSTGSYIDCIVYFFNGEPIIQAKSGEARFEAYKKCIDENNMAKRYYIEAYKFSKWLQDSGLKFLRYSNAYDEVVNTDPNDGITDGQIDIVQLWPDDSSFIFSFNDNAPGSKSIETEFSNFNQHRLAVIRKKIETNLAIAISNYNSYSGANTSNVFQIPQMKETEWDSITHNIALISFMQGLPIGGKLYNGYSIVTNSESDKVVFEENIYILSEDPSDQKTYCRIGDEELKGGTRDISAGDYSIDSDSKPSKSAGRLNLDFERAKVVTNGEMTYYYPLREYNASYNSVVMQDEVTTYDDIYEYIEGMDENHIAQAFYTALARERASLYMSIDDIIDTSGNYEESEGFDYEEYVGIIYHLNDGSGKKVRRDVLYGELIKLIEPEEFEPEELDGYEIREEYEFLGWYDYEYAEGTPKYIKGTDKFNNYNPDWNNNLYAAWELRTYPVTYYSNDGMEVLDTQTKKHGEDFEISLDPPSRDGYDFMGWATSPNATSATYPVDQINVYTENGPLDLYAVWKPYEYTVTYNANGGNGEPSAQKKIHGQPLLLSDTRPTREGYDFMGWATPEDLTKVEYKPGYIYEENKPITLYAVWELETYEVKYNANGGTGEPSAQTKTYGQPLTLSDTRPTKYGYDFIGWATSSSATTKEYEPGDIYEKNQSITLYAVWKPHEYTVTYNANRGTGEPSAQTKTHGQPLTLSTEEPKREGYIFVGWDKDQNAETARYPVGKTNVYTDEQPITLYAVWKPETYEVTYDVNADDASGAPKTQIKTYGIDLTLSQTIPTRYGYDFMGWDESQKAKTATYPVGKINVYTKNEKTTLYAIWKLKTYEVKYDANEGTGAPGNQTKTHGEPLTLSTVRPKRTGYIFVGWDKDQNAETAKYPVGQTNVYTDEQPITLYAVWELETYEVKYNANGGNRVPENQTKKYGIDLILTSLGPEEIPERYGYDFMGWATSGIAKTAEYQPGGKYEKNEGTTLYAVWNPHKYTVTYDANGGNGAPVNQTKEHDTNLILSEDIPTKKGYDFMGWATPEDLTKVIYKPGGIYEKNEPITLYAVWEIEQYQITFEGNGGTFSGGQTKITQRVPYGGKLTPRPSRTGYSFLGWDDSPAATKIVYEQNHSYEGTEDKILYAVWKINEYKIQYNENGGSGAPDVQTKTHGVPITLSDIVPEKKGYIFKGWKSKTSDKIYQPGGEFNIDAHTTLYAVWQEGTYPVTYYAKGGTGAPANQTKIHDVNLTLSEDIPSKTGYTFKGWSTSENATSVTYPVGQTHVYTENKKLDLYAVWQADTYTVTYHAKGGTETPANQTKTHDVNLTLSEDIPSKTGYTFKGWSISENATSVTYPVGQTHVYTENKNLDLYAVWQAKKYNVEYYPNGGTGVPATQTKEHDVDLILTPLTPEQFPTRKGYKFLGWATSSNAKEETHRPGDTYKDNNGLKLYAVWERMQYLITYNTNEGAFSDGTTTRSATIHYESALTSDEPIRYGYKFLGWADSSTAKEVQYKAGAKYTGTTDAILYAVWKERETCTIIYDKNGSPRWASYQPGPQTQTVYKGEEAKIPNHKFDQPIPAFDGIFTHLGWSENKTAKVPTYKDEGMITISENYQGETLTLYGVWQYTPTNSVTPETNNTCTLKYDLNGHGTWLTEPGILVADVGTTVNITRLEPDNLLSKEYTFMGWSEDPNSNSVDYKYRDTITLKGDTTLYAVWRNETNQYYVGYNGNWGIFNTGTGLPGSQVKTKGVPLTLSTKKPKRDGYTFKGWATSSSATTVEYKPGATYTNDESLTLYAVWVEGTVLETYSLVFDANGGSGSQTISATEGTTVKLPKPYRTNYNFTGWSTPDGEIYSAGAEYEVYDNMEFMANWVEKEKCTIKFDVNHPDAFILSGGTPISIYKGDGVSIPSMTFLPPIDLVFDGVIEFKGWSDDKTAKEPDYTRRGYVTISEDYEDSTYTLYGVWEYIPTNSVTATTKNTRTIRYDANGGEWFEDVTPEVLTVDVGTTVNITKLFPSYPIPNNPNAAYSFLGWSTDPNAKEGNYKYSLKDDYGKITVDRNIVLYAIWNK